MMRLIGSVLALGGMLFLAFAVVLAGLAVREIGGGDAKAGMLLLGVDAVVGVGSAGAMGFGLWLRRLGQPRDPLG